MTGNAESAGPEFSRLSDLARSMGLRAETLIQDTRRGEVTGIRLYHRRWVVHRGMFDAWWRAKCLEEAQEARPIRAIPGSILCVGRRTGRGALARAASNL